MVDSFGPFTELDPGEVKYEPPDTNTVKWILGRLARNVYKSLGITDRQKWLRSDTDPVAEAIAEAFEMGIENRKLFIEKDLD